MREGSGGSQGSRGGVKILVVHGKGECSLGDAFSQRKNLSVANAGSEHQAISEAARLRPNLVILAESVSGERLQPLVKNLRDIVPRLPIFLVVGEYNHKTEKHALQCDITAVFSGADDPSVILANALAVCEQAAL